MYNDQIRIHAGVISKLMDNTAGLTLIELKEKSKLSDKELYLAIGWLVSEKKSFISLEQMEINCF